MSKIRRLFWDIETSPNIVYSWRIGYKIQLSFENIIKERAIICICWKWEDEKKVHSLTWDNGDDYPMVQAFLSVLTGADEAIAHNGDKFDVKWFNARCAKHDLVVPEIKTVDTLVIARRWFLFNSNRLDYLGKHFFGKGKVTTGFDLWKGVCDGDKKSLKKMVHYCKNDVVLLQRVWDKLQKYHKPKTHAGVLSGREKWTCVECGSMNVALNKKYATTSGMLRYGMLCGDCRRFYTLSASSYRKFQEEINA